MKKLLVGIAIVAAAAACGGGGGASSTTSDGSNSGTTSGKPVIGAPAPQYGGAGGSTDQVNPVPNVVPTVQGPQVIRTAQLTMSVGSGLFDSKLSDLRTVVEQEGDSSPGPTLSRIPPRTKASGPVSSPSWSPPPSSTRRST